MNLKALKRKFASRASFGFRRYSDIDKNLKSPHIQSSASIKTGKLRGVRLFFSKIYRNLFSSKIFRVIFLALFIAGAIVCARYFLFSEKFDVKEINIYCCDYASKDTIQNDTEKLLGKNIFLSRSSSIEKRIMGLSTYIKEVKVNKDLPDTINIDIVERIPRFLWINLYGAYLADGEGIILEEVKDYEDLDLSEDDYDLLRGYGDLSTLDSTTVNETTNGDEDNGAEGEEVELSIEEKRALIEAQRIEVISKVEQFLFDNTADIGEWYRQFNTVYSYFDGSYDVRSAIRKDIIENTNKGIEIDFFETEVARFVWESDFRFVIYFEARKKIIFSSKRDFVDQIGDLELLLADFKMNMKEFQVVDLSSEIIMYELEQKN